MNITLAEKNLDIRLSPAAEHALAQRQTPLLAEMELLFSCLIRKRVRFGDLTAEDAIPASDRLSVRFRPVMTRVCAMADVTGSPPLDDFPIANPRPYVPRWLAIDYRRGQWLGEFGY
ncbi:MAG: hypothetical protein AUJ86_03750 [Hydrogenophilaceae bacterium CG1_02_62_390]|nr:MAG: hypothetical protein AUJ86_03750 [Hydrogenophilaceae bacterium CG1_02_62_390]PIW37752.1 MAG: hypothetical protein COW23_10105 [Hydrogenophilales bacterium CG15_BIG_FIL_POST_REV_8_21_14_020_62_31]